MTVARPALQRPAAMSGAGDMDLLRVTKNGFSQFRDSVLTRQSPVRAVLLTYSGFGSMVGIVAHAIALAGLLRPNTLTC
jgi:hypothetical protein